MPSSVANIRRKGSRNLGRGGGRQMKGLSYFYKSDSQAAISAQACHLQDEPFAWGVLQESSKL